MKVVVGGWVGLMGLVVSILLLAALGPGAGACGGGADRVNVALIPAEATVEGYDADQLRNAGHIMNAAASMELPPRAQQIGVMTAMGESSLRNVRHGDDAVNPDGSMNTSKCLFQQQHWWGSEEDRCTPETAARLFFERLVKVPGWETMDPSAAAHTVQVNADPDHYTRWWDAAVTVTGQLAKDYGVGGACASGSAVLPMDQPYNMTDDFGPRSDTGVGASTWHPAIDLARECGATVRAMMDGTVTRAENAWLSIRHDDGFVISYLHMASTSYKVVVGQQVKAGQEIGAEASEGQSTGCHLDVRVNVADNTNPQVAGLPLAPQAPGYANPEGFFQLFGLDVCPADWCVRNY
ncbi:M23 family metallopeptidase [Plantibacter sp. CFBP 8804]|uniref:M23 family metallopeptidase n=1 Tax=Plantibacter sp. CFBP 8804 TaxID=2775270 RepID=UPI00177E40B4|nr:M23 family metallopeptidase [Plantibacter sp. CFBP 8804]MBD8519172.1 M23 family metallopeptidase [Plantibacter sp. CFBP 8804]